LLAGGFGYGGAKAHWSRSFLLPRAGRLFFKKEALALLFAPDAAGKAWMPAFAGMTGGGVRGLRRRADIFLKRKRFF
jgi:hypothetical protein